MTIKERGVKLNLIIVIILSFIAWLLLSEFYFYNGSKIRKIVSLCIALTILIWFEIFFVNYIKPVISWSLFWIDIKFFLFDRNFFLSSLAFGSISFLIYILCKLFFAKEKHKTYLSKWKSYKYEPRLEKEKISVMKIFLRISGICSAILFIIAGSHLISITSISGDSIAESFYHGVGWMSFGFALLSGALLIGFAEKK